VVEASDRLLKRARESREPAVMEIVTYRYRGHSVADAGLAYRTKEEISEQQAKDPILRLRTTLRDHGMTDEELDAIDREVDERVAAAVAFADASPEPEVGELARSVYAPGSAGQFARMRPGSPFGEEELVFNSGLGS
jgi:pyruvate dehydrogenase E1 component alpha subunit